VRSHTMRRSGATALLMRGLDFPSIALYGRWASLSACKEYLKVGEVGVLRLRNTLTADQWAFHLKLAQQFHHCFLYATGN
jgi:hypothetical protein